MGRWRVLLALAVVVLLAAAIALVRPGRDGAGTPASGDAATGDAGDVEWYLALGDSLAAGVQPVSGAGTTDRRDGYAEIVREELGQVQAEAPELTNLGCPGETAVTFVEGGRCPYPEGSQLAAARAFLRQQPDGGARGLVTVQVGANDVQRCVTVATGQVGVDEACVASGLAAVRERLPAVLEALRGAAPEATLVVLDYYNPFAALTLLGPQAEPLAARSVQIAAELDEIVAQSAAGVGADVAAVGEAFGTAPAATPATTAAPAAPAAPTGPTRVGRICALTWMCGSPPDVHPTSAGYHVIADAVLEALPG